MSFVQWRTESGQCAKRVERVHMSTFKKNPKL